MSAPIAWTSDLDHRPYSWKASGEGDAWGRWVPDAWIAAADPAGNHAPPAVPLRMGGPGHHRVLDDHAELLAWWAPLMHVTMFGLGWPRPDLGIHRWQLADSPTEDPLLALINTWWGRHLGDFLAWSSTSPVYAQIVEGVSIDCHAPIPKPEVKESGSALPGARWFGANDEMHWHRHITPMSGPERWGPYDEKTDGPSSELLIASTTGKPSAPRATLLLTHYAGWYRALQDLELPASPNTHGWRVDVICKPLGWLGQYRKSRTTGRWFRGQHRWHQLGA